MQKLTPTEISDINDITEKWMDHNEQYCGRCIERAIDHFDRNVSSYVDCDDSPHYTRYDITEVLGDSDHDIHLLLDIIKKLTE